MIILLILFFASFHSMAYRWHIVLAYCTGILYWHIILCVISFDGILYWHIDGILYWHIVLAYCTGILYGHIVLAYCTGIWYWHIVLVSSIVSLTD